MGIRVLVRGPFDTSTGYGNDLVGLTRGLRAHGFDVQILPTEVTPPIPPDIASLLSRPTESPVDLTIIHVDPQQMRVPPGLRKASRVVIGWTMWEWESFLGTGRSSLKNRLKDFDGLLMYDETTVKALTPFIPKGLAASKLQGGFWSSDVQPQKRDWTGPMRFCMLGKLHERKNPFAAIEVFRRLSEKHGDGFNAELHLKTTETGLHPKMQDVYPWLTIYQKYWPREVVLSFYAQMHCYLAPSRGEGKNVPALEAMASGIPVIATQYGGHNEWLGSDWAYPLRWTPREWKGFGVCAEPDIDHFEELVWQAYSNREETRRKGDLAARVIPPMCDWVKVVERLMDRVKDIPAREPILSV